MTDRVELLARAERFRRDHGLDAWSPIDIYTTAQQIEDLTLVCFPMGPNISGLCSRDKDIKLIAINTEMSYGRQRFSLAHELYHLLYDEADGYCVSGAAISMADQKDNKSSHDEEKEADQFATYLLAPYQSFQDAVARVTNGHPVSMEGVIHLEQYYGMSHRAMLWRLVQEGALCAEQVDDMSRGVIQQARRLGYDDRLYRPTSETAQKRVLGYYMRLVDMLRDEGLISAGKEEAYLLDAFREDVVYGIGMEDVLID